jgi:hypothetical protein
MCLQGSTCSPAVSPGEPTGFARCARTDCPMCLRGSPRQPAWIATRVRRAGHVRLHSRRMGGTPAVLRACMKLPKSSVTLQDHAAQSSRLQFKRVSQARPVYSVRISRDHRAVGILQGEGIIWYWIGSHQRPTSCGTLTIRRRARSGQLARVRARGWGGAGAVAPHQPRCARLPLPATLRCARRSVRPLRGQGERRGQTTGER